MPRLFAIHSRMSTNSVSKPSCKTFNPRPSLIELYLVEMPVTSGITLDAAVDFSPFLNRWAESLDVHQRVSPFDPTYKDGHCSPVRSLAGPHFRAALRSLTWPSNRKPWCVGNS